MSSASAQVGTRDAAPSLEALPPAPRRPVQWRRAWEQVRIIQDGRPEKQVDAAYSINDALGGMNDERLLRRLLRAAEGRELLARRPDLVARLGDREALRALPEASFGRAYLAFAERHGLDSRKLVESQHRMSRDFGRLDPLRQWLSDRLTVLHDLWHVLAGYDATTPGESALICFSIPQGMLYRPMPLFVVMLLLAGHLTPRCAWAAFRRGRRARWLVVQPFEELLALPLDAVRERLAIAPPALAHAGARPADLLIPA